jgi:hypothetical protein
MKQADMPHVQPLVVVQLMVLLGLANGTPVIAKKTLGNILARPLDGGMNLADGQPLFGDSKTIRGIVLSIVVTTLGAPLIGVDWTQHGTWPGSDPGIAPTRDRLPMDVAGHGPGYRFGGSTFLCRRTCRFARSIYVQNQRPALLRSGLSRLNGGHEG